MSVIWISLAAVLLFALLGYSRGVLRIVAFLGSLLLAGLAALPLGALLTPLLQRVGFIPRALVPVSAPLAAGLVVLVVVDSLAKWALRRRARGREAQNLPRVDPWERLAGALLGGLWGCTLVALVLTGLHFLGRVNRELAKAATPPPGEAAQPGTTYQTINTQIDASPLASVVRRINPAEDKVVQIFGSLARVAGDQVLLDRFRRHPAIARLTDLPQLKDAAADVEIQQLLDRRDYYALLDHPKLAALAQDKELVAECRKVDLAAVLTEVQKPSVP
jgi:hypothetical protein